MTTHFQAKVSEYGQLCLRAPEHEDAVGLLWRINEFGGRSATGYFGQVILFPARMNPSMNTNIDYRIPNGDGGHDYFTAAMPELTDTWQDIAAEPGGEYANMWYDLDKPDAPHQSWKDEMEYDLWLLEDN